MGEIKVKIVLLLLGFIAFVPSGARAVHWVGLYADLDHSVMEMNGQGIFDVYLWIKPTNEGAISTELLVSFPGANSDWLACVGKLYCDDMTLTEDDITYPATGGSIDWSECAIDWKWVARMTFVDIGYYVGAPTVGYIRVKDNPISGEIWITDCTPDHKGHIAYPINWFGLNIPYRGTEESSWGAIKNVQ